MSLCKAGRERREPSLAKLECHRDQRQINTELALHVAKISMSICLKKSFSDEGTFSSQSHCSKVILLNL